MSQSLSLSESLGQSLWQSLAQSQAGVVVWPALFATGLALVLASRSRATLGRGLRARAGAWRHHLSGRLRDWIVQAGIPTVAPPQLITFCLGVGLVAGLLLLGISGSPWVAVAFACLGGYLPIMVFRARARRRLRELEQVWPEAIDNLTSGIRAGLSLGEAVAALAERGPEPLRLSFARFADTYHASGRFGLALDVLKEDLADPTADRVIEALRVAREVGGSELGRTLRTLSSFLHEDYHVRREIEARQTWIVVAARLAFAIPWLVLLLLSTQHQAAIAYRSPTGAVIIAVGGGMVSLGYWLMLRVGRIPAEQRVLR